MTKQLEQAGTTAKADSTDLAIDCVTDAGSDYSGVQGGAEIPLRGLQIGQVDPMEPDPTILDRAWQELHAQATERPPRNGRARKRASSASPKAGA